MVSSQPDTPADPDNLRAEELLPLVYDELRRLAASRMLGELRAMTLQPTALVHEAWIRLGGKMDRSWESREHFFNAAALTMRRILMDRARQKATVKHGGMAPETWPIPIDAPDMSADERLLPGAGLRHRRRARKHPTCRSAPAATALFHPDSIAPSMRCRTIT